MKPLSYTYVSMYVRMYSQHCLYKFLLRDSCHINSLSYPIADKRPNQMAQHLSNGYAFSGGTCFSLMISCYDDGVRAVQC